MNDEIVKEIQEIIDTQVDKIEGDYYIAIREACRNPFKSPELETIKYQICRCIVFGLYIAAMTLLNHLLEKALKILLAYNDQLNLPRTKEHKAFEFIEEQKICWARYNSKNLWENIDTAFKKELIDDNQKKILIEMKDNFRNSYAHSDREKMYKEDSTEVEEIFGTEQADKFINNQTEDLPKKNEKYVNLTIFDFLFVNNYAERDCIPYLINLDSIIRCIESKIYKRR